MPTLSGKYAVSELCNQLGASAPWIRKIEGLGLLAAPDGKVKGKRRFYTEQEARLLSDIVTLRHLGFEFEEIGYLKQIEEELATLLRKALEASVHKSPATEGWVNTVFCGDFNGRLRQNQLTDKERMLLLGKLQEHERIITRIRDAITARIQQFNDVQQRIALWLERRSVLLARLKQ
jgi:DNA-binding transcriptional MerR regulator